MGRWITATIREEKYSYQKKQRKSWEETLKKQKEESDND